MMIELAGITFNDTGRGWVFADLVDWYSVPDSKAPDEPIPQAHGSFDPGVDWRSSAAISFTAGYIGDSKAECIAALEAFNAVGSSSTAATMRVTDELRTTGREVSIRHIGVPDFFGYDQYEVHFAVDVLAHDPFRYGPDVMLTTGLPDLSGGLVFPVAFPIEFATSGSPGRIAMVNEGTQATRPRFAVVGGLADGFSLACIETGHEIRFEFPLSDSDVVTVDARSGRAWLNAEENSVTGYLTKAEWWSVPPGATRTVQFNALGGSSGAPMLTGVIAPAYL